MPKTAYAQLVKPDMNYLRTCSSLFHIFHIKWGYMVPMDMYLNNRNIDWNCLKVAWQGSRS